MRVDPKDFTLMLAQGKHLRDIKAQEKVCPIFLHCFFLHDAFYLLDLGNMLGKLGVSGTVHNAEQHSQFPLRGSSSTSQQEKNLFPWLDRRRKQNDSNYVTNAIRTMWSRDDRGRRVPELKLYVSRILIAGWFLFILDWSVTIRKRSEYVWNGSEECKTSNEFWFF